MAEHERDRSLSEPRIRKAALLVSVCVAAVRDGKPIPEHCEVMGFEIEEDGDIRFTSSVNMEAVVQDFDEPPP